MSHTHLRTIQALCEVRNAQLSAHTGLGPHQAHYFVPLAQQCAHRRLADGASGAEDKDSP
jgi:hypothetical protein